MKFIYMFGVDKEEEIWNLSSRELQLLLGNKGAGLFEMARADIPVPPGFIITTDVCRYYFKEGKLPDEFEHYLDQAIKKLENKTEKRFADRSNPLVVSVRSGAAVSMPGMMDTILNLGVNDEIVQGLCEVDPRFAYDAYRRFIQMFAKIVLRLKIDFEKIIDNLKKERGKTSDIELQAEDFKELVSLYKAELARKNISIPQEPRQQLLLAIKAVLESWNNERAISYRELHNISHDLGTAVIVQTMVFGNLTEDSGTGVAFTRDPTNGENTFWGEYLLRAQGEDVVAGIRTPRKIEELKETLLYIYEQLLDIRKRLEEYYKDMQDIEFTVEKGKLYMLQTRTGKRTSQAAIKIAVDLCKEGMITKEEAILRVAPKDIDFLLHNQIAPNQELKVIAKGLGASPGVATGKVVFYPQDACRYKEEGIDCILVRHETSPEDIAGIAKAAGILTARGGMTSHAAVVTRAMGKSCVVGCEAIHIDYERRVFRVNDKEYAEGDIITIDGTEGRVIEGEVILESLRITPEAKELLMWADEIRSLGIRANADTPADVEKAVELGAEGIGLCRTEHMFFFGDRLKYMQEMILAKTPQEREEVLSKLKPHQEQDFIKIFKTISPYPVTIRLIDPPLHEFLPKKEELLKEAESNPNIKMLLERVEALSEINPMLGLRGCRLGILYPEIIRMQAEAIFSAACKVKEAGYNVDVEVMVPLVCDAQELKHQRGIVEDVARKVLQEYGVSLNYKIGTMIEVPRACLNAAEIAKYADFFSFGTNDLTQTTYGLSRDDAEGKFLDKYLQLQILAENPFSVLDRDGVGKLMKMAIEDGKSTNKELKIGICGEHGGDPQSIEFCHELSLDYVSCSPYRIPIARLCAAQAAIKQRSIK